MRSKRRILFIAPLVAVLLSGCNFPTNLGEVDAAWRGTFSLLFGIEDAKLWFLFVSVMFIIIGVELVLGTGKEFVAALKYEVPAKWRSVRMLRTVFIAIVAVVMVTSAFAIVSGLVSAVVEGLNLLLNGFGITTLFATVEIPEWIPGAEWIKLISGAFSWTSAFLIAASLPALFSFHGLYYAVLIAEAAVESVRAKSSTPLVYWFLGALFRALFPVFMVLLTGLTRGLSGFLLLMSGGEGVQWFMAIGLAGLGIVFWKVPVKIFRRYEEELYRSQAEDAGTIATAVSPNSRSVASVDRQVNNSLAGIVGGAVGASLIDPAFDRNAPDEPTAARSGGSPNNDSPESRATTGTGNGSRRRKSGSQVDPETEARLRAVSAQEPSAPSSKAVADKDKKSSGSSSPSSPDSRTQGTDLARSSSPQSKTAAGEGSTNAAPADDDDILRYNGMQNGDPGERKYNGD